MRLRIFGILIAVAIALASPVDAFAKKGGFRFFSTKGNSSSFLFKPAPSKPKPIFISRSKHPDSAKHIEDAQKAGSPKVLTIDRKGRSERRRQALSGTATKPGMDRDEYPPAVTKEGGKSASVRHIPSSDNRGSGACIGAQCRDVPNGKKIRIDVVE